MIRIHRLKSRIRHFLANRLRELVRIRTASALARLDDRLLAHIGVPRHRIAEYAREVAHISVPIAPMPPSAREGILARLSSRRERRETIRELSALDDRLLRDIGIERGRIADVVDAAMSQPRDHVAARSAVPLLGVTKEILVPARHPAAATPVSASRPSMNNEKSNVIGVDEMPNVHPSAAQATNECQPPELRRQAAA